MIKLLMPTPEACTDTPPTLTDPRLSQLAMSPIAGMKLAGWPVAFALRGVLRRPA